MILEVSGIRDWEGDDGTDRAGDTRRQAGGRRGQVFSLGK